MARRRIQEKEWKDQEVIPSILEHHPFTKEELIREKEWILSEFSEFDVNEKNFSPSLFRYLSKIPDRFFCRETFFEVNIFFDNYLQNNEALLCDTFYKYKNEISIGLNSLFEINSLDFHERAIEYSDAETFYFLDTKLHPTLLKLVEGAFSNLILPISAFLRLNRSKSLDGLDIYNCVAELKKANLNKTIQEYSNTIRNSIAHGSVKFNVNEIVYADKKNSETLAIYDVIRKFDKFIDICNGLSLAVILFHSKCLSKDLNSDEKLIKGLAEQDLKHVLKSPGWEVDRVLESETTNQEKQLNIFVKNKSFGFNKVNFHSMRTGVITEKYISGYDRYFVHIKSKFNKVGWDILEGDKLHRNRIDHENGLERYSDVRGDGGFFFWPFKIPRIIFKAETLLYSFHSAKVHFLREWRKAFPRFHHLRKYSIHRNGFFSVAHASILLLGTDEEKEVETIGNQLKKIMKGTTKEVKRKYSFFSLLRYLPVGYMKINVYNRDFRERQLGVNGLPKELICTVLKQRIKRIKEIDIIGGTPEVVGNYRIVWNKAFLDSRNLGSKTSNN
ncbi:MAG: hypothetical protein VXV96_15185 [Bdellovibrionota bacterium]|nr:hypothetical protein [Bdellovibrionota bacterium]